MVFTSLNWVWVRVSEGGGAELAFHYGVTSLFFSFPDITITAPFPSPSLYPPFHSSLVFSSAVCTAGSFFPSPLDVISKTRSPWQQLVTSSSPTLVFDGCFYFLRVFQNTPTSLADCQVTCSAHRGTMLPSVGSVCLHTSKRHWKKRQAPPPPHSMMTHDGQSHGN